MSQTLMKKANEYRENAALLWARIGELKEQLSITKNTLERMQIRGRILHYESVYADNMCTARYLENYHRGGEEWH